MMALSKHKIFNNKIKASSSLLPFLLMLLLLLLILIFAESTTEARAMLLRTSDKADDHGGQWYKIRRVVHNDDDDDDGKNGSDEVRAEGNTAVNVLNSDANSDCKNKKGDTKDQQDDAEQTTSQNQFYNGKDNNNNNNSVCSVRSGHNKRAMINEQSRKIDDVDNVIDAAAHDNENDAVNDNDGAAAVAAPVIDMRRSSLTEPSAAAAAEFRHKAAINFEYANKRRFGDDAVDVNDKRKAINMATEEIAATLRQKLIYAFAIKQKQIPRITYLTCSENQYEKQQTNRRTKSHKKINMKSAKNSRKIIFMKILQRMYSSKAATLSTPPADAIKNQTKNNNNNVKDAYEYNDDNNNYNSIPISPKDIFIRVVQIDQLINNKPLDKKNNKSNGGYNANENNRESGKDYMQQQSDGTGGLSFNTAAVNPESISNWLETALRPERLRQIVVLDLVCGSLSRQVIEMASNKGLFSTAYHWLLIDEDYAVNRQTPINDNNNNDKRKNVGEYNNNANANSTNNNNNVNDVDSVEENKKLKKSIDSKTVANRYSTKLLPSNSNSLASNPHSYHQPSPNPHQQQEERKQQQQERRHQGNFSAAEEQETERIIEKLLEKINININTELILAKLSPQRGNVGAAQSGPAAAKKSTQRKDYVYTLYDVWNPGQQFGGQLNITEIGNFSLDDGLQLASWYRTSTTVTQRMDMKRAHIRCLIVVTHKNRTDTLEHYLATRYDTHLDSMHRFNFALLAHVRDLYNFSLILSETSSWGYLRNGTFDGMIGALTRKEADIGGSPIFFRLERAKVIDYTARTWVARPCFIFRHPRNTESQRIVFLQPFTDDIWILIAVCSISAILLLWALASFERRMSRTDDAPLARLPSNVTKPIFATGATTTTTYFKVAAQNSTTTSSAPNFNSNNSNNNTSDNISVDISKVTNANGSSKSTIDKQTAALYSAHRAFRNRFVCQCSTRFRGHAAAALTQSRVGLFFESVLLYIGLICQQGVAYSTRFLSGRFIIAISLFFSFAIYQFYSASIVGTLLMEKPKTIRTLRNLIHSSLEIGIEDIPYNRDFFVRTNDPDALELYITKVTAAQNTQHEGLERPLNAPLSSVNASQVMNGLDSNWYDPEYGVNRIQKGGFAFHVDVATAYKIISDTFSEKEICDLSEIQLFPPQKMVSIVQKGSPLRKVMTYGLRRITEAGLTDHLRKVWHSPKPRCVKQIHVDDLRVDMQTFTSAFLMLIYGFAVSLLTLVFEILHRKLWQRLSRAVQVDESKVALEAETSIIRQFGKRVKQTSRQANNRTTTK